MSERMTLSRKDALYTHQADDAYRVTAGSLFVFIVPWSKEKNAPAGKRVSLCDVDEGHLIPSFAWKDENHREYRFLLMPRTETAEIHLMPGMVNRVLKRKFIENAGLDHFEEEGFEGCLVEYYRENELKDDVFVARTEKHQPEIVRRSIQTVVGAVAGNDSGVQGDTAMEKAVRFACKKAKVTFDEQAVRQSALDGLTVPELAPIFHFLCREVVLEQGWNKMDCGIMIAQLNGSPVVLYPSKKDQYYVRDVTENTDRVITKEILEEMEPKAWMIGRTLPEGKIGKKEIIAFVKKSFRKRDVISLIVTGLLSTLIGVLQPKINQLIYDEYIPLGDSSLVVQVSMVIATFMIGNVFISIVKQLQEHRITCRAGYELQDAVYWRLFDLPQNFFRKYDSADLAQRIMGLGQNAQTVVSSLTSNALPCILALIYLVQMFIYSYKLALAALGMLIVWNIVIFFLHKSIVKRSEKIAIYDGEASGKLYQFLNGVDKIRMSGTQDRAIFEYLQPVAAEMDEKIRSNRISAFAQLLTDGGATVFSMVLYAMIVLSNIGITAGKFMAFNTAFGAFSGAFGGLVGALVRYIALKPTLQRVKPVLETPVEASDGKDQVMELQGNVQVDHVTFGYNEGNTVLNDVSIQINQGEYIALVGPSGCGKSTLLKLLLGFEAPRNGRILYDGRDLSSLEKHSLRKHIGVVLQNGMLISGTIFDNIAIAGKKQKTSDVMKVVEDVGLKEDIEAMPMGIHTMVNEYGGTISGGQQQRILIARAIYSNPSVLYFDEATSALDNVTQAKVCESLEKRNMTRVVIAHRLSTVQHCDRIYVMQQGGVVEVGNYESLMAQKGLFYQMAIRQIAE